MRKLRFLILSGSCLLILASVPMGFAEENSRNAWNDFTDRNWGSDDRFMDDDWFYDWYTENPPLPDGSDGVNGNKNPYDYYGYDEGDNLFDWEEADLFY